MRITLGASSGGNRGVESIIKENKFTDLVSFHDEFYFLNKITSGILAIKKEGLSAKEFSMKLPLWEDDLLADENIYYKKNFGEYKKGDIMKNIASLK